MTDEQKTPQEPETAGSACSAELGAALRETDFQECTFPPGEECCDRCDKDDRQLYYRRTSYEYDEGEYYCGECVIAYVEGVKAFNEDFLKRVNESA